MKDKKVPSILQEARLIADYVVAKNEAGIITHQEARDIIFPFSDFMTRQGYADQEQATQMVSSGTFPDLGAIRHATHLMQKKLLELHPELREELLELREKRSR